MISGFCQGKPFNITAIQVYTPTSKAEEAEVEWSYEDLQDLLELTCKKDVLFIIGVFMSVIFKTFGQFGALKCQVSFSWP